MTRDADDVPRKELLFGRPTGSARPAAGRWEDRDFQVDFAITP